MRPGLLGGGSHPGAGRKPKAATADKQATPKAAPAKRPAQKSEAIYVDRNGVRSKDGPANWPFGTVPPSAPSAKEYLFELMPLDFLLQVMHDEDEEKGSRIQAATAGSLQEAEMALSRYSALVLGYNGEHGSSDQSACVAV